jgi:hypothetical protein
MRDPFFEQTPRKLAKDPELAQYFGIINATLSGLTTTLGPAIEDPVLTSPTANEAALQTTLIAILAQMRNGTIKT